MSDKCNKCNALHFQCKKYRAHFSLCCQDGKISLPHTTMPDEIQQLYLGNDEINKNFREGLPDVQDVNMHTAYKRIDPVQCLQISRDLMSVATPQQLNVINEIMTAVRNEDISICNAYFIDGPGGTGKTYVYWCLINNCWGLNLKVIPVAWTGIAAMLLPEGRTVHSRFKLPLQLNETSVSALKVNSIICSLIAWKLRTYDHLN